MDTQDTETIHNNTYYQEHKERLNHERLKNYHKTRNNIPVEFFESYIINRKLYNLIKNNKATLNKQLILHLLE